MTQRDINRSFVARVFLYGMATGLMIALVLCFIDSMLSHRLGACPSNRVGEILRI
jgi:hypothetical protein